MGTLFGPFKRKSAVRFGLEALRFAVPNRDGGADSNARYLLVGSWFDPRLLA